jgi:16S rRNA (guanine1207-N2)-methyltransferase
MADTHRFMLPFQDGEIHVPDSGAIVVFRAQSHGYPGFPNDRLICSQGFFPIHATLQAAGHTTTVEMPTAASLAIVHLTRSKAESRALIATAYEILVAGGQLVVDGAKTDGIESFLKAVKSAVTLDGTQSKSHGKVFWFTKHGTENPFADWKAPLQPTQNVDGYFTAAGIFSTDGIDPGSALLAQHMAGKLKGTVCDLGAGWGWLAMQALSTNTEITRLDLIEAEHAALNCARLNVTDARARFLWADATHPTSLKSYDVVISNPPFHTARKADPALGKAFIHAARAMLKPSGQLFLVANRQLAYEATLNETFARTDVLGQTGVYKLIHARKPK